VISTSVFAAVCVPQHINFGIWRNAQMLQLLQAYAESS